MVAGKLKPADSPIYQRFNTLLGWTDKFRRLGIRANADHNPMLGHRGCSLGITYPDIYRMQTRAIVEAALHVE